ncbi:MAG TPA: hypothetical protein VKP10_15975 [Gemmatimonadales bacterium]|nr:hypothetical protein [Gemmatimonadales bacterium]
MNGCLRGVTRLFVFLLLLLGVAAAWWYRAPLARTVERFLGRRPTPLPAVSPDSGIGAPSPTALASAQGKLAALGRVRGPDSVVLTPNEMASLVGSGIDWSVRRSFDSLRVELGEGVLAVHARLDTRLIPTETLGPLRGLLADREPLRIAGPVAILRPGLARWTVRQLSVRGFPFPPPAVRSLARQAAGADSSGAVALRVDSAIADVAIHPARVVLYHRRRP